MSMKGQRARLLLVSAVLPMVFAPLALAVPALGEVAETSKTVLYEVSGSTAAEVREQMILNAPKKEDRPMYGHTSYNIRWSHSSVMVSGHCAVTGIRVTILITKTVPALISNNEALKARFAEFRERLDAHEEGHANNGRSMARRMDRGITALPPAPTCEELTRAIAALGKRIGDETTAADQEYDRRTGHGRTEGVVWPLNDQLVKQSRTPTAH